MMIFSKDCDSKEDAPISPVSLSRDQSFLHVFINSRGSIWAPDIELRFSSGKTVESKCKGERDVRSVAFDYICTFDLRTINKLSPAHLTVSHTPRRHVEIIQVFKVILFDY